MERRERKEREWERRVEAEEQGAGSEEQPLFLPTPPFTVSVGEELGEGGSRVPFVLSFVFPFVNIGAHHSFLEKARAVGKGELATRRHRADSGGKTVRKLCRRSLDRLNASTNKQKKIPSPLVAPLPPLFPSLSELPPLCLALGVLLFWLYPSLRRRPSCLSSLLPRTWGGEFWLRKGMR